MIGTKNQGRHFRLARLIFAAFSSITMMGGNATGHWPIFGVKVEVARKCNSRGYLRHTIVFFIWLLEKGRLFRERGELERRTALWKTLLKVGWGMGADSFPIVKLHNVEGLLVETSLFPSKLLGICMRIGWPLVSEKIFIFSNALILRCVWAVRKFI